MVVEDLRQAAYGKDADGSDVNMPIAAVSSLPGQVNLTEIGWS
jgi:hypothetical protein